MYRHFYLTPIFFIWVIYHEVNQALDVEFIVSVVVWQNDDLCVRVHTTILNKSRDTGS